jgi:hypothetical protein
VYVFRRQLTGQPKAETKPKGGADSGPKAKEARLELRVYALKHANAVDMSNLVTEALQLNAFKMTVVPSSRTNQLVVNATMDAHLEIQALLNQLDVEGKDQPAAGGGGFGPGPSPKKKRP